MKSQISINEKRDIQSKTAKPLLWVAMGGMTMIFASLTSAYIVRQADADWLSFDLPSLIYVSTLIIIISSITLSVADICAKRDFKVATQLCLMITFLLSIAFVVSQFKVWGQLMDNGLFFSGSGISASFLYVLTLVHLVHVLGGNFALLFTTIKSLFGKYSSKNKLGIELVSWYWHYLTGVWIFLLIFLRFIQ